MHLFSRPSITGHARFSYKFVSSAAPREGG